MFMLELELTEPFQFAMIISQDQVWFLNPCKAHISIDKAILRLPLSVAWR